MRVITRLPGNDAIESSLGDPFARRLTGCWCYSGLNNAVAADTIDEQGCCTVNPAVATGYGII
jgi:hypothetical protein